MHYEIKIGEKKYRLDLVRGASGERPNRWLCRLDGRHIVVDVAQVNTNSLSIVIGGRSFQVWQENRRSENGSDAQRVFVAAKAYDLTLEDARSLKSRRRAAAGSAGPLKLTASMPGKVVRVLATKGERIQAGAGILVIEAMKMQNELRSPKDGSLKELLAREGMNVNTGDVLAVLE